MGTMNCILIESCRLCQKEAGLVSLENDSLLQRILLITKINVKVSDDLSEFMPNSICTSCCKVLEDAEIYIKRVQRVDGNLKLLASKQLQKKNPCIPATENLSDVDNLNNKWKCEDCPLKFDDELGLHKHLQSHEICNLFSCPVCQKTYRKERNYELHKKNHPELFCSKCCKVFNTESQGKDHSCGNPKTADNKSSKKNLGDIFNSDTQHYLCPVCNETFHNRANLATHLKKHKNKRDYICSKDGCSKVFSALYLLKAHKLIHEGKKPFLCVTCGKKFRTKNSLECHEKIHLEIKSYHCEWCDLSFSVRSNLRAHLRAYHEGVRYYCSQCSKAFVTKCTLDRHEKTHLGIKDFKCQECSSEFYTNKELKKHQRYHQGLKPFQCEQCLKTFFENHHLTIHLRIHSGERPYVCNINQCRKAFIDKQKLKRHQKSKHKIVQDSGNTESTQVIVHSDS